MARRRVLLLAATTGYQTRSFGAAAADLDLDVIFATDRCSVLDDPWGDRALPVRFEDEERSAASVVDALRNAPIHGILAVGDRPTVIAARVAASLGLPWHSPHGAAASRDKLASRRALADAGLHVPTFVDAPLDADPRAILSESGALFPCVLKPLAMSGSRGVIRADDAERFVAAFTRIRSLLRTPDVRAACDPANDRLLIESFIPGREYALEGLLAHGALRTFAIFDKPDPLDGPFFEETIYATPSMADERVQHEIARAIERAALALGLWHGPVHGECRVNDGGVFVLEVAARPIGGLCARALRFVAHPLDANADRDAHAVSGARSAERVTLEHVLLRFAVGDALDGYTRERDASAVMMIPIPRAGVLRAIEGEGEARRVEGVDDVVMTAKVGEMLTPLPEGASYLGFIFARGATSDQAVRSVRRAHERLRFVVDAAVPMAGRR